MNSLEVHCMHKITLANGGILMQKMELEYPKHQSGLANHFLLTTESTLWS